MTDLNRFTDRYQAEVEKSISFVGQGHDFFVESKSQYILDVYSRLGRKSANQSRILDVGCGIGLLDGFLQHHFKAIDGVDVARDAIDRAARANPKVSYLHYDGFRLPYQDNSFDLVFAVNVMHHIPPGKWESITKEMARVTNPMGLVMIVEHNPLNPLTRLAVKRCEFDEDAVLLSSLTIRDLLNRSGSLAIAERSFITFFPFRFRGRTRLERWLRKVPIGAQHYAVGRKEASHVLEKVEYRYGS